MAVKPLPPEAPWPQIDTELLAKLKGLYPDRRPRFNPVTGPEDAGAYARYCGMVDLVEAIEIQFKRQHEGGADEDKTF